MKKKPVLLLFMLALASCLWGQKTVEGIITDDTGNPVPGANVVLKGTATGTVSDLDGKYIFNDVSEGDVLVFSFLGMIDKEITLGNQTTINVQLETDRLDLESVVVIGYGEVKKKDLTSSIVSVSSEEIVKTPTSNPMEALQGKVTGMDITRNSGTAGSGVNVLIRGTRSINADNDPLYVIDGIQGGSINDLNPFDIESINVLKDASATAIYGSQGANGVVIVTTKKGASGKAKISYNGYYGVSGFTPYPKVRMEDEYIEFRKEAYRSSGDWDDAIHNEENYDILFNEGELAAIEAGQWVDWLDLIQQNGKQQNHQISLSAGNEKTKSYFSLSYFSEEGIIKNDVYDRYTARVNVDHDASSWISLGMQSQFAYIDRDRRKDPFSTALTAVPLGEPYGDSGEINIYPVAGSPNQVSPLTDERSNIAVDNTQQYNTTINAYLEIKPFQGLQYRSSLGSNFRSEKRGKYNDATSLDQKNTLRNFASIENSNNRRINWDNVVSYSKLIGEHSISATALTSYIINYRENSYASGYDQTNPNNLYHKLDATSANGRFISSDYYQSQMFSYAGRLNYVFAEKYVLSATGRYDLASPLSEGKKGDFFPSVSAAWKLHEEAFVKNISFLDNLKLRGGWGVSGNSSIEPYSTQKGVWSYPIGFGEVANTAYKFNDLFYSKDVGWERSKTVNVGLDLGIFGNRVNANVDVYNTNTEGLLLKRPLPRMTGVREVYQNIGSTQNRGIEVMLNTVNISASDFRWISTITYSKNNEKIVDLVDGEDIIANETDSRIIGSPVNTFYTYEKLGIWQEGEEDEMDNYNYRIRPGDIKLADLNNDSIIDGEDRKVVGSPVPKWFLGFENTFSYKNFELSIYLFARWGQTIDGEFLTRYNPSGEGNGPSYFDYWTPNNPTNDYPRPRRGYALNQYFGYQTLSFVDGSYFKIKNVRLSYTLPQNLVSKTPFSNFKIYATASNLLTVSKSHLIQYYDPERGGSESAPLSKQFIFGVNVDF